MERIQKIIKTIELYKRDEIDDEQLEWKLIEILREYLPKKI